jgi:aspartyl/asparaginyl-tRNA synthetase
MMRALKILKQKANIKIPWGKDLRTVEEDELSKLYDTPIIILIILRSKGFLYERNRRKP